MGQHRYLYFIVKEVDGVLEPRGRMRGALGERRARKRVVTIFGQRRGEVAATIGFFWTRAWGEAIAGQGNTGAP